MVNHTLLPPEVMDLSQGRFFRKGELEGQVGGLGGTPDGWWREGYLGLLLPDQAGPPEWPLLAQWLLLRHQQIVAFIIGNETEQHEGKVSKSLVTQPVLMPVSS